MATRMVYHSCEQLVFSEKEVREAAVTFFITKKWQVVNGVNPRSAPSDLVTWATYDQWVASMDKEASGRHICHYMPLPLRRCLLSFKLGCHKLDIQAMRMQKIKLPREQRTCRVCNSGEVEDIMHFILDCGHYAHIRARHSNIFDLCQAEGRDKAHVLRLIFDHEHQLDLASCLQDMSKEREEIMEKVLAGHNNSDKQGVASVDVLDETGCISPYHAEGSIMDSSSDNGSDDSDDTVEGREWNEVIDNELTHLGFIEVSC